VRGFLGLGSNEGDRLANLRSARKALEARGVAVVAASSVWETAPQGLVLDQREFLNACVEIDWPSGPEALLDRAKEIERALGRSPGGPRHGPRPIDVDVLMLGDLRHASARLVLPHPELRSRAFVIVPLLEIDPELRLPEGDKLDGFLASVSDQPVRRVGPL